MALLMRGIEQEHERDLEDIRDFEWIGRQRNGRFDPAHDRRNAITGHRLVIGELAQHLDAVGGKSDFFGCFTQRRGGVVFVVRLDAAARKLI